LDRGQTTMYGQHVCSGGPQASMNQSSTVPKSRYGQQRRPLRGSMHFMLTDIPWEGCNIHSPLRTPRTSQLSLPGCRGRWMSVRSYCTCVRNVPLLESRILDKKCALSLTVLYSLCLLIDAVLLCTFCDLGQTDCVAYREVHELSQ
jgi:hypothetical protein